VPATAHGGALPLLFVGPLDYATAVADTRPVFQRPAVRGHALDVVRRALTHPAWTIQSARRLRSARGVAALLLWRETASWFGYDAVEVSGAGRISLQRLVGSTDRDHVRGQAQQGGAITGLVIAQDEERLIARVLRSLAPFVVRTVVVDGGSRDATPQIARAEGAQVVTRPFDDNYAAQRNAGLAHVTTPWTLMLDCDETLTPELGSMLTRAAETAPVDAVFISLLNLVGDDPRPTLFPDVQPRLFRSHLRYRGRVHERLRPRAGVHLPANGPFIHHHKSPLRHYGNSLHYSQIDAGQSTPELVAWMEQEVARLHREGPGEGDLPRTPP
jgi:Glycosyl transferase family 2